MHTHPILHKIRKFLSYRLFTNIMFVLLGVIVFGVLYTNVKPKPLDLSLYEEAPATIRAPKTLIDDEATEKKKEAAAAEVEKIYSTKDGAVNNAVMLVSSLIDSVNEVKNKAVNEPAPDEEVRNPQSVNLNKQLEELKKRLPSGEENNLTKTLTDNVLKTLLTATETDLERVESIVSTQLEVIMGDKVKEDELKRAALNLEQRISSFSFNGELKEAAIALGNAAILPTEFYDEEKTEQLKKQAVESVQSVEIVDGEVIVEEGDLITPNIYETLNDFGMVEEDFSIKPIIGLALFIVVIISSLYYFFYTLEVKEERKQNYLILTSIVFVISLIIMKITGLLKQLEINDIAFLFPAAFTGMILRILLNERIAMMMVFIISACASIVFNEKFSGSVDIEVAIYTLFSGVAGILTLVSRNQRTNVLRAGIYVALVNIMIIAFLVLLSDVAYSSTEYIYYLIFALVSGIGSSILTIGFLPFFETGFGILSSMRLVELSSPNQPLLKKLLTDAPGTYHHSVMVANLAESACEAIGANGLLARVGCYYHDVGKSKRPHFFIENQLNLENPHDRMNPETSKNIIIDHASDGAAMLRKYKLPKEIVDIAEQHHGTTLLKYFYYKAKEQGKDVTEVEYRYPGPKPQTKETAIINIADSVEAAVRSKNSPTQEEIKQLVAAIVKDRLSDGQFNECDISLKELEKVKQSLCETLNGIYHPRIEYPELKAEGE
ncbi:HD family phosphohydrolase [Bacillus haikouensis]|uniref:HD family phosphohydrolase n=1 Tax=Bacillus haikouensis TaxID=1510468 RepID=UPI0015518E62|nr:HD family phosphohydrolase [Bacillus haikouensis]NQD66849.1 HD family phosphohydrolase [Bacillus haikouensis]